MNFSIDEIIYRVTLGDRSAFAQLCRHFRKPALQFCLALLKDEVEAEIVMRDTFEKVWENRMNIQPGNAFSAYLFVLLRNQVLDHFKKMGQDQTALETYLSRTNSGKKPMTQTNSTAWV